MLSTVLISCSSFSLNSGKSSRAFSAIIIVFNQYTQFTNKEIWVFIREMSRRRRRRVRVRIRRVASKTWDGSFGAGDVIVGGGGSDRYSGCLSLGGEVIYKFLHAASFSFLLAKVSTNDSGQLLWCWTD